MMNGTVLGDAIAQLIIDPNASAEMQASIKTLWENIATQIVTHIQTNAQVLAGIPVATAGSPTAQTGATTGPGTIT